MVCVFLCFLCFGFFLLLSKYQFNLEVTSVFSVAFEIILAPKASWLHITQFIYYLLHCRLCFVCCFFFFFERELQHSLTFFCVHVYRKTMHICLCVTVLNKRSCFSRSADLEFSLGNVCVHMDVNWTTQEVHTKVVLKK